MYTYINEEAVVKPYKGQHWREKVHNAYKSANLPSFALAQTLKGPKQLILTLMLCI